MKYRCIQHIDTHIEMEVEAKDEAEAEEKGMTEVLDMAENEYSRQLVANAEIGEWIIEEIT